MKAIAVIRVIIGNKISSSVAFIYNNTKLIRISIMAVEIKISYKAIYIDSLITYVSKVLKLRCI